MSDEDGARILFLGAGHANLLAVTGSQSALPHAAVTLIDAAPFATYSGMFPGYVAGLYSRNDMQVDLARFAARHRIEFVQGRIEGVDSSARQVELTDGRKIAYDLAALDLGSHTAMPEIAGFDRHAMPVKPLDRFADRLAKAKGPAALIGGGVAGAEMALALSARRLGPISLIEAGPRVAASLRPRAQDLLRRALDRAGIRVLCSAQVVKIDAGAVILKDGRRIPSLSTIGIAGARAHDWLARDLPVDGHGFVRVTRDLQVEGNPSLFAAGDCAAMSHAPRPKAGVFAVRQAPVLAANLIAALQGQPLTRFDPQADHLKIISLGGRRALAEWRGLAVQGRWLWHLKDRIDRRFMRRLQG